MSFHALGWASLQRPKRATDKLVLLALADRHNPEEDASWPSLAWLTDFCCLDRKTVIACLDRLQADGLITDMGERTGRTKQIKVYHLAINSSEIGIPKTEPLEANGTVFPRKEYRKRDTEPVKEPEEKKETLRSCASDDARELVDDWNSLAEDLGLPKVAKLTDQRKRHIRTGLKRNTLDEWQSAFRAVRRSSFLQGENKTGWKANFDFLLQPSSFAKLIEGFYDGKVQ